MDSARTMCPPHSIWRLMKIAQHHGPGGNGPQPPDSTRIAFPRCGQRHRESVDVVSKWPHVRRAIHMFPTTRETRFDSQWFRPPLDLTSVAPPPPIHCTSLPVWPSTRHLWPPPRSMCSSQSSGLAGASLWSLLQRACAEKQAGGS